MSNSWGKPELKSFKNNFIRKVSVDDAKVFVHRNVVNTVEDILIQALENGAKFDDEILPSFQMDDSEEAKFGVKFQIPNFNKKLNLENSLFEQIEDVFVFSNFSNNTEIEVIEDEPYFDKPSEKIGHRQLGFGDSGKDVKFLAYFLGMEDAAIRDKWDKQVQDNFDYFQRRMGMPLTKSLDWDTWNAILPKPKDRIAAGTAGLKVRVLQAALRVNGYNVPTTSRFGTETIRAVREFQQDNNLRITGRVGFIEWQFLFRF